MDWTSKTPFQWDWETLALFSGKECEISKSAEEPDWKVEGGLDIGSSSVYSSGGGAYSGSAFGNGSSKSSISAPIHSSLKAGRRMSDFNFDSIERVGEDVNKNKGLSSVDTGTSTVSISADGTKEPIIGLKLGKRTYFEDVSAGNGIKNSSSTSSMSTSTALVKKSKVSQQNMQSFHCLVEGCNIDLSTAKEYHRKHRVCESHSKSPKVIVAGQERRFCQQCSRFHDLSAFDQKKRSCRRRLSDHNARRRKPQPQTISFSSSMLSASYYDDDKRRMNLIFGQAPFSYVTTSASSAWDFSGGFQVSETKGCRVGGITREEHFPGTGLSNFSTIHETDRLLSFKGTTAEVLNQGLDASTVASNLDGAQELRRALSLLSTDSFGPSNLGPASSIQFVNRNSTNAAQAAVHAVDVTPGFWQDEQLPAKPLSFNLQHDGLQFQEFQLRKTACTSTFVTEEPLPLLLTEAVSWMMKKDVIWSRFFYDRLALFKMHNGG